MTHSTSVNRAGYLTIRLQEQSFLPLTLAAYEPNNSYTERLKSGSLLILWVSYS